MTTTLFAAVTVTSDTPPDPNAVDYPIILTHAHERNTTLITITTLPELHNQVVARVKLVLRQLR